MISTECFEHDSHFPETFAHMIGLVADGGILIFTCATTGRPEHGTDKYEGWASPGTLDYYRNIAPEEVSGPLQDSFRCWGVEVEHGDLYGWGLDPRKYLGP